MRFRASVHSARIRPMKIYGLPGTTHGGARTLTVMCPQGASRALAHMARVDDLIVNAAPGRLTQYLEKRSGALEKLIDTYEIQVLSKTEWDWRKEALGEKIWT